MKKRVILVHGDKGGAGKSMVARALLDLYLEGPQEQRRPVAIIDADTQNTDVGDARSYGALIASHRLSLRDEDGWVTLLNVIDQAEASHLVVSLPSGIGKDLYDHRALFGALCGTCAVVPLWVLGRTPDSVVLLRECDTVLQSCGIERGVVAVNTFWGAAEHFRIWNGSALRKHLLGRGWVEILYPALNDLVVDRIGRKALARAYDAAGQDQLGLGEKTALGLYRRAAWTALAVIETLTHPEAAAS